VNPVPNTYHYVKWLDNVGSSALLESFTGIQFLLGPCNENVPLQGIDSLNITRALGMKYNIVFRFSFAL
jgi:hypothetical protein